MRLCTKNPCAKSASENFFFGKKPMKNFYFIPLDISLSNRNNTRMKPQNQIPVKTAFSFYLPLELLDFLKQEARRQRRSVNFVVTEILVGWVSGQKEKEKCPQP